jgi:hypothetical protein
MKGSTSRRNDIGLFRPAITGLGDTSNGKAGNWEYRFHKTFARADLEAGYSTDLQRCNMNVGNIEPIVRSTQELWIHKLYLPRLCLLSPPWQVAKRDKSREDSSFLRLLTPPACKQAAKAWSSSKQPISTIRRPHFSRVPCFPSRQTTDHHRQDSSYCVPPSLQPLRAFHNQASRYVTLRNPEPLFSF